MHTRNNILLSNEKLVEKEQKGHRRGKQALDENEDLTSKNKEKQSKTGQN